MFEEIFKNKRPDVRLLLRMGFKQNERGCILEKELLDGAFILCVTIDREERLDTRLIEKDSGVEYDLYKTSAEGPFVGKVRGEIGEALAGIAQNCYLPSVFCFRQTNALCAFVKKTFGDKPEFLFERLSDCAVFRHKDSKKWYGAVMTVPKSKLGFQSEEKVEIVDLHCRPDQIEDLLARQQYYPGWHMNKKSWYTIILDGSIPDEELFFRVEESYALAQKKI